MAMFDLSTAIPVTAIISATACAICMAYFESFGGENSIQGADEQA